MFPEKLKYEKICFQKCFNFNILKSLKLIKHNIFNSSWNQISNVEITWED